MKKSIFNMTKINDFINRFYGYYDQVKSQIIKSLRYADEAASKYNITFYLENHEDLKGTELHDILSIIDSDRILLNFDVGNVINALDSPLEFYDLNKNKIGRVHLKDIAIIKYENGSQGQLGVPLGQGQIDLQEILFRILVYNDTVPFICLEQELWFHSPPRRFINESESNPYIPEQNASITNIPDDINVNDAVLIEMFYAKDAIIQINRILKGLLCLAKSYARFYAINNISAEDCIISIQKNKI